MAVQSGRSGGWPCRARCCAWGEGGTIRARGIACLRGLRACLHMAQSSVSSRMLVPDANIAILSSNPTRWWSAREVWASSVLRLSGKWTLGRCRLRGRSRAGGAGRRSIAGTGGGARLGSARSLRRAMSRGFRCRSLSARRCDTVQWARQGHPASKRRARVPEPRKRE